MVLRYSVPVGVLFCGNECVNEVSPLYPPLLALLSTPRRSFEISETAVMSKSEQLFLLADHVKLSLLERQRAKSLGLDSDSQDGHISRSLDQLRHGLSTLKQESLRLGQKSDDRFV